MRPSPVPGPRQLAAHSALRAAAASITLAALVGCNDSDSPTGSPPTPTIGVQLASATLSIAPGQSGSVRITVSRGGGYDGAVTLTVTGAPAYVTAALDPSVIPSAASTSALTCAADAAMGPATYVLTVTASAPGVVSQSASLVVTIVPTTPPSIGVSLTAGILSIASGENGSVDITVSRHGTYTGAVELAVTGAPPGVTSTLDPVSVAAGALTSTLTLTVAPGTAVGAYPIKVFANGAGVASQWAPLSLVVLPAAGPSISVGFIPLDDFVWTVLGDAWTWPGVVVARHGGYTGVVHLSVEGLPPNVTASFAPPSLGPNDMTSAVTFTAAPNAAVGETRVTIRAKGEGVSDATTVVRFVVFPPAR